MEFQTRLLSLGLPGNAEQMAENFAAFNRLMAEVAAPADRLPFNKPFSGRRKLAWGEYAFAEARGIRAVCGGTVNDVVLAALGGAAGRYVAAHGQPTAGRSLKIFVPVNVRRDEERAALGNRVSLMPVQIPLDAPEPLTRLRLVRERTEAMKQSRMAERLALMSSLLGTVPPALQALFGAMAASPPVLTVNMVCTNVPGPQIPLYAMGQPVLAHYPLAPVGYEVGVSCAVMSYNQKLFITFIADAGAAPDVERLKEFFDASFAELRDAAGIKSMEAAAVEPRHKRKGARAG